MPREPHNNFQCLVNESVAFVDLGVRVWRLPVSALEWARNLWPVYAKQLPSVQTQELKAIKRQFRQSRKGMTPALREQFSQSIGAMEKAIEDSAPRFAVYKSMNGRDVPVHQLWLSAESGLEIGASDGDYTNYCDVRATVIISPKFDENEIALTPGVAQPGDASPRIEQVRTIPNLYLKNGSDNPSPNRERLQTEWENGFMQVITNKRGEVVTTLKAQAAVILNAKVDTNTEVKAIQKAWEIGPRLV